MLVVTAADASVRVKLGMAADRGSLDLSECDLLEVPPEVFDIPGLEVRSPDSPIASWSTPAVSLCMPHAIASGAAACGCHNRIEYCRLTQELSLVANNLTELPAGIGKLTALKRLQLAGNQFVTLPDEIGQCQQLDVRID